MEVELQQLPATFTGTANYVSGYVSSGTRVQTPTATGLAAGNYGWRYRVVDSAGVSSNWVTNGNPDFMVQAVNQVTLTLYVDSGSVGGPVLAGALVTGSDAAGTTFKQTTGSGGYVTITGTPGIWQFTASDSGYNTSSWSENINATKTLYAYLAPNTAYYSVTTSSSPANGGGTGGGGTFSAGSSVTATATPNAGYTFANWTENGTVVSSSASYAFTLNGNRNLVANFTVSGASSLVFGFDSSAIQQQDAINWPAVASGNVQYNGQSYPVSFVILRASKGNADVDNCRFKDPDFTARATAATNAGLIVGAYHVAGIADSATGDSYSAVSEADFFASVAGSWIKSGNMRPFLDVEDDPAGSTCDTQRSTYSGLVNWVDQWMAEVVRLTGVTPIIYCNGSFTSILQSLSSKYELWIAKPGTDPSASPGMAPWNVDLVQYGWNGTISGVDTTVDMDVFQGTQAEFQSRLLISGTPPPQPTLTGPPPGSTLTSCTATFQWSGEADVTNYFLYVGRSLGTNNIYDSQGLNTSDVVSDLPGDGSTVYVRLWWATASAGWKYADYTYTAPSGGCGTPAITSPPPGSTLTSSTATFQWSSGTGVTNYYLYVGKSVGTNDIYDSNGGLNLSSTVTDLPTDGSKLYVRLWWVAADGAWHYVDYTYTAFTAVNYTVATSSSPASGGTTAGGGTFAAGRSVTVTATANGGYSFANWTENGAVVSSSASYTFTLSGKRNLVANFAVVDYTVGTSSSPASGGGTAGSGTFAAGTSVTVTATGNGSYAFANWTENGAVVSSSASYTFTLSGNRNLVANFTLVNYTVATSSSPASGGTTTGGGTLPAGSSVTVTATPNGSYAFANWTENGAVVSSSPSYTFTLSGNRTLVANFAPVTYIVGVSASPSGAGTAAGGGTFAAGSSVTVTASANTGYQFANWTEGTSVASSSSRYTFTLSGNRTLVANFTQPALADPADTNGDFRIVINEVTGYGAAWKRGDSWPNPPNPIPIDYVTRAGYLWKNGECYGYDSTQSPPLCWVSKPCGNVVIGQDGNSAAASPHAALVRDVALSLVTNSLVTRATTGGTVSLIVQPDDSVSAYAVEESLPVGITPYDIEGDGSWDPVARQVKWGPYLDNTPRTLSYRVGGIAGLYEVAGVASYDGQSVAVIGQANVDLESSLRIAAPVLSPSDGGLVLTFPTQPDRAYYVEVSTDLSEGHWQVAAGPLAGNGQCLSWKAPAGRPGGAAASRFYRVRMAP